MMQEAAEADAVDPDEIMVLSALTDEELAVLGAADDIGVLPIWSELTDAEKEMGARTAFRGLMARGLVEMPSAATVRALKDGDPDADLEIMVREDLESTLLLRKGCPAVIATARTAAQGQDFL